MSAVTDLLDAYPTVTHAVSFVELIICAQPDMDGFNSWRLMMVAGCNPEEVREAIKEVVADEVALGSPGKHQEALTEMDCPEFMVYLRGKMGAM